MRTIRLAPDVCAMVDDEDYDRVAYRLWRPHVTEWTTYAIRTVPGTRSNQYLHTLITGWQQTDHRDGDGLNNLRSNLREATQSQNLMNTRLRKDSQTGYKGVSWDKERRLYQARIFVAGKRVFLGRFGDATCAAQAYDVAATQHFGEWAKTNKMLGLLA